MSACSELASKRVDHIVALAGSKMLDDFGEAEATDRNSPESSPS